MPKYINLLTLIKVLVGLAFPLILSGLCFLVLYNNTDRGFIILLLIAVLNVLIFLGSKVFFNYSLLQAVRTSAVCVLSIVFSVILLEVVFPVFLPKDYSQIVELTRTDRDMQRLGNFKPDRVYGKFEKGSDFIRSIQNGAIAWHKPGANFIYFGYDPNTKTRYINFHKWNSTGYFDHDYRIVKPKNVFRVVVIGDSYVESVQVPLESTFHKLTEDSLNAFKSELNRKHYEFIALGNSGYGQRDELDVLRTQGLKYEPDLVIIALCGNDFCDDDPELKWELVMAGGTIRPTVRRLAHHGFLALAFVKKRSEDIFRNRVKMNPELLQWSRENIPRVEKAWTRTLDYARNSRDLCEANGIKFLLLYVGSEIEVNYKLDPQKTIAALKAMGGPHATMSWDIPKSVRRMKSYCKKFHINFASMVGPLAEAQQRTGQVVFADHYSFFGQQVVAETLTCFMKEFTILGKTIADSIEHCFESPTPLVGHSHNN